MKVDAQAVSTLRRALVMLQSKAVRVGVRPDGTRMTESQTRAAARGNGPKSVWAKSVVASWDRRDGKKAFPRYLPNGDDIETVEQVAAMLGTTKGVAARYVLEEKALPSALYAQAKAMTPGDDFSDGVMVALMLDPKDAKRIAVDGGVSPNDLHVTLGYWGDISSIGLPKRAFDELCRSIVGVMQPFDLHLNGITRFAGDDDQDPVVVNADAPEVEQIRKMVTAWDDQNDSGLYLNHGYTPHMTIGYIKPDDPIPMHRWDTETVRITTLALHYGRGVTTYRFGQRSGVVPVVRRMSA